ncbi:MAG TPA: preprotein translocase subunit SecG [Steroidobacteraceae bacterium]|nr:preprotein translocase subunit SecG [Steroidobacteraceae bacterium]
MLRTLLTIVQVLSSLAIIGLVLLQKGKGAEAGAGFGSGASGTVFGARGATTALSRATAIFAAIFMLNSLALAYLGTAASKETHKTLLEEAAENGKAAPQVPGAGTAQPSAPSTSQPSAPSGSQPLPAPAAAPAGTPAPSSTPAPVPAK